MSNDLEYQQKLAIEHISTKNCRGCKFFAYNKENAVCLFHSEPIENCNLVQLAMIGELDVIRRYKVQSKRSDLDELI